MRYAQIRPMDISNGEGIGVALFTQGCPIHCKGCFQPETWDFEGGKDFGEDEMSLILELMDKPHITRFSILGGEPLSLVNLPALRAVILNVKCNFPEKKIWMWTGYTWDQIVSKWHDLDTQGKLDDFDYYLMDALEDILANIDYLIAGPFIEEQKDLTLLWRGSRNQEVLDMKASINWNEMIKYVQ